MITKTPMMGLIMVVLRPLAGAMARVVALLLALAGEVLTFLTVSAVVERDRPDVSQLDAAPPTSSVPSGHTGAAVALYGYLAVISPPRDAGQVARPAACRPPAADSRRRRTLAPVRGMHYPADVVFGAVNGAVWAWLVMPTVLPRPQRVPTVSSPLGGTGPAEDLPQPANRRSVASAMTGQSNLLKILPRTPGSLWQLSCVGVGAELCTSPWQSR